MKLLIALWIAFASFIAEAQTNVIYAGPVNVSKTKATCNPALNFYFLSQAAYKRPAPLYGWTPAHGRNFVTLTVTNAGALIEAVSVVGYSTCAVSRLTFSPPANTTNYPYLFTVYFSTNMPTNAVPLTTVGFKP